MQARPTLREWGHSLQGGLRHMAYYPCQRGPHFNPGQNHLVYLAIGSGNDFHRWRSRYCGAHLAEIQDSLAELELRPEDVTSSRWDTGANCLTCLQPIGEGGLELFVTCYPTKNERKDYWAKIHPGDCTTTYLEAVEALTP